MRFNLRYLILTFVPLLMGHPLLEPKNKFFLIFLFRFHHQTSLLFQRYFDSAN